MIVCDLVDNGEANELEVLSDTRQILKDLVSWYRQQHSAAYIVEFQGAITPFTERFAERVSGNALTIRLRQPDDYDECAIPLGTPIPAPPFCEPATYTLNDTSTPPNQLSTGSIPSGGSAVIVAPDGTVLRDGQPFGSVPSGGSIDVPSDCPPCADGNIELNGTPVGVVASGGTTDIPVIQDGLPAGSWNGTQWVITSCPQGLTIRIEVALAADTFTFTATANEAGNIASVNDGGLTSFVLSLNAAPVTTPFTIANGDVISAAFTAAGAATTVTLTGTY